MNNPVLISTFFLTLLLMIGLFFFIRASTKDRTERIKLVAETSEESLLPQLQQYFDQRAYQVTAVDRETNQVTLEGFVAPSWFLAIFLSLLALVGLSCLTMVLYLAFPDWGKFSLLLTLLAPGAGIFYWQKAGRVEKVALKIENLANAEESPRSLITVTAHRDELIQMQQALPFQPVYD